MPMMLAVALQAAAAPAASPPRWHVAFEDETCVFSREVMAGSEKVVAAFRLPMPTSRAALEFFVVGSQQALGGSTGRAIMTFPSGKQAVVKLSRIAGLRALGGRFDALILTDLAADQAMTIQIGDDATLNLPMQGFNRVVPILANCQADLAETYGINRAEFLRVAVHPEPIAPASWYGSFAYPSAAKAAGATGRVVIRVAVSLAGRPTACVVARSSGDAALDRGTCAVMMKSGRFKPARDGTGAPIAASTLHAVNWELSP